MSGWYARVLYAKHVSRKRKTWQDGFMSMNKQGDTRRSAKLYDESGLIVAKGHLPASEELTTTSEGISAFEGWIVNIDSECLLQDLPGQSDISDSLQMPVQPAQHSTDAQKPAVAQQPCKWKSKFQKPRAAKALPCDAAVAPCNTQDNIAKHLSEFMGKSPNCIKQAAAKQSAQTSSVPKRSDDEILGVLSSFDIQSSHRAEAIQTCDLAGPDIKRKKLQHQPVDTVKGSTNRFKQAQTKQHQYSKWEEFTEPNHVVSQLPEADSSFCLALGGSPEVLTLEPDAGPTAGAAPARCLSTEGHDNSVHPEHWPNKAHESAPGSSGKEPAGATTDSTNTPEKMQSHNSPWQQPTHSRTNMQANHTLPKFKVPVLGKHKGFKAPAMVPGHHPSQPQLRLSGTQLPHVKAVQAAHTWQSGSQPAIVFCGPVAEPAVRHAVIPTSFASLHAYKQAWCAAVTEEINIRLVGLAEDFHTAMQHQAQSMQKGGVAAQVRPRPADLEKALRSRRIAYYSQCDLLVFQQHKSGAHHFKGGHGKGRIKKSKGDDSSDEETGKAEATSGQERPSAYQKDDIWVLSSDPSCQVATGGAGARGTMQQGWVLLARSSWHGPNKEGRMQIQLLSDSPPKLQRKQSIYAIHGPNATTELAMLATLQGLDAANVPALPALLSCKQRPTGATESRQPGDTTTRADLQGAQTAKAVPADATMSVSQNLQGSAAQLLDEHARRITAEFRLNTDQVAVLAQCSRWASADKDASPVCIIHGPFGCGKSSLLVALIHYLLAQRSQQGSGLKGCRVLLSAHTNIAVDRLMNGLQDTGCTDMVRVGALRRISKTLLLHSLHAVDSKAKSDAVSELREMLAGTSNAAEAAIIQRELDQLKQGADRQRRKRLKSAAVVGVTCCSAGLPVLEGHSFDVVLLDEASQMVEPLTLNPLTTAKPRFIIMAGDPCQLPPVVAFPASVTPRPAASAVAKAAAIGPQVNAGAAANSLSKGPSLQGLARPLLVRLVQMGHHAHLLRTQYRCHPDISRMSNALYYNGQLIDGCTAAQRAPLLPGLSAVCFVEVRGQQQYGQGSSSASNRAEAQAVVQVIQQMTSKGISSSSIGVICFFRAQVALIQSLLHSESRAPQPSAKQQEAEDQAKAADPQQGLEGPSVMQVATVDSFQGMEKDIILLATTITHAGNFATDAQRVNVAFTRAKHHLVVLGSSPVLRSCSPAFRLLLAGCQLLPASASLTLRSTPPKAIGTKPPPSSSDPPSATSPSVASLAATHAQALGNDLPPMSPALPASSPAYSALQANLPISSGAPSSVGLSFSTGSADGMHSQRSGSGDAGTLLNSSIKDSHAERPSESGQLSADGQSVQGTAQPATNGQSLTAITCQKGREAVTSHEEPSQKFLSDI